LIPGVLLLGVALPITGCGDHGVAEGSPGAPNQEDLYRAPAISNVIDGVIWDSGNWEPDLAPGAEGVSWGNHRAVVALDPGTVSPDAVVVTIPWRRHDPDPESKGIVVVDAATGQALKNAVALRVENASGDVAFQPSPGSSTYYVYYMPWQSSGGYYPTVTYPTPPELRAAAAGAEPVAGTRTDSPSRAQEARPATFSWVGLASDPDPAWERRVREAGTDNLPRVRTTHLQSVNDFHSFFPMEIIATPEETAAFWQTVEGYGRGIGESEAGQPWALVPEHRDFPIRMKHFLPQHWMSQTSTSDTAGAPAPSSSFRSQVLPGEAFTFQLGVVSGSEPLQDLTVSFHGFPGSWQASLTCFNTGGVDEKGVLFTKRVDVLAETIQPLWIGVRIPEDQPPGPVSGTVTVTSQDRGSKSVPVVLQVGEGLAYNAGFDEPELQTRLFWLNSTLGSDPDAIIEPFEPVGVEDRSLSILGRRIELGPSGFPEQIFSYFTPDVTSLTAEASPLLARPLTMEVVTPGPFLLEFSPEPYRVHQDFRGRVDWTVRSTSEYLDMTVAGVLEYDGMLDLHVTFVASTDVAVDDIALPVSMVPEAAEYMLGLGRKGGKRPPNVSWKWAVQNHQEGVWLGGVNRGLQYVLRDENYVRPLNTNFYQNQPLNLPPSWYNGGLGGILIAEESLPGDSGGATDRQEGEPTPAVTAYNYSGPRTLLEGDTLHFNVRILLTPFKAIDPRTHFNTRFVHQYVPVDSVQAWGGTVVNIHHANEINPFINYPFFNLDLQKAYIDEAHGKGIKVKLYNTIRELTYHAHELFALRSLGDEILNDGEGGGHSWMQEHLEDHYHSAWHAWTVDDAAMLDKGTSRWTNYYIEGVNWLAANQHIDGLYLDDIAFSRETVKRIVTVLHQNRPEVVIDLHSANQFNVRDGFINSAMLYMEHFPFISRLWFGEYFEYDLDADYWMTEVSGIPFGLMGEMLQGGGHPYRGMLYGMTARKYGEVDPRPVWAMMNQFGIADSEMRGYWLEDTPITTSNPLILATTYLRPGPGRALIALASWSGEDEVVALSVDWEALGLGDGVTSDDQAARVAAFRSQIGDGFNPSIRAFAPRVEGLQEERKLDLSAVPVPAGQGLFVLLEFPGNR